MLQMLDLSLASYVSNLPGLRARWGAVVFAKMGPECAREEIKSCAAASWTAWSLPTSQQWYLSLEL